MGAQSRDDGSRTESAAGLMLAFLERSGAEGEREPARYLWTDAFAVCNLLALERQTGESKWREHAEALIHQVHRVLGRHRPDDPRNGWISGLSEEEGARRPTAGGLRIGKPLAERAPDASLDERSEWNRDGQYFHYLSKWAQALDRAGRRHAAPVYGAWSRELMTTACEHFIYSAPGGGLRMYWKMSIDLGRPLVASMGHHDPLDGYIRCLALRPGARDAGRDAGADAMGRCAQKFSAMIRRNALPTGDPLGIGGLLMDAGVLAQLIAAGEAEDDGLLAALLQAAMAGAMHYERLCELERGPAQRLAFRELGLAIGLQALNVIRQAREAAPGAFRNSAVLDESLAGLQERSGMGTEIERFWSQPAHQAARSWLEHEDINAVMLATSLVPAGLLELDPGP